MDHASVLASFEAPIYIALPIIAVVIVAKAVFSGSRRRAATGAEVVVRCSKGHVFKTTWSPLGSLTSLRLGFARFQHCPVGQHWALARRVSESELTDADRRMLNEERN